MSSKKKVPQAQFEEGHKRETRKSYQEFLKEITPAQKHSQEEEELEMSDDGSARRSRRAPVPKRSFDLIDKYETKDNPLKKKQKTPCVSVAKANDRSAKKEIKREENDCDNDDASELSQEEECRPSRRSGRPPKPKKSVDFASPIQSGRQKGNSDQSDAEGSDKAKGSVAVSQSIASKVEATLLALKKKKAEKLAALVASQKESLKAVPEKSKQSKDAGKSSKSKISKEKETSVSEIPSSSRGQRRKTKSVSEPIIIDDPEIKSEAEVLSNEDHDEDLLEESDHSTPSKGKSRQITKSEVSKSKGGRRSKDTITESYEDFVSGIGHKPSKVEDFPGSTAMLTDGMDTDRVLDKRRSRDRSSTSPSKAEVASESPKKKRNSKALPKIEIKTEVTVTDILVSPEEELFNTLQDTAASESSNKRRQSQEQKTTKAISDSEKKRKKSKKDKDAPVIEEATKNSDKTKLNASSKKSDKKKKDNAEPISVQIKDENELFSSSNEDRHSSVINEDAQSRSRKSKSKGTDDVKVKIETGLPFLETFETVEASNKKSSTGKRKAHKISCSSEDVPVESTTGPSVKKKKKSPEESSSSKTKSTGVGETMKIKITTKNSSANNSKKKSKTKLDKPSPKKSSKTKVSSKKEISTEDDKPIILEEDPDYVSQELDFQSPELVKDIWSEDGQADGHLPFSDISKVEPVISDEKEQDLVDKKAKKKEEKKHQKVVDVQFFNPDDTTIVKVKKKKIYKKKHGEKILVRIIKNHINKNGDTVKTETVVIDKNDEKAPKLNEVQPKVETPEEEEEINPQLPDDELELHIKLEDVKPSISDQPSSSKSAPTSNKKPPVKTSTKSLPKTISTKIKTKTARPANKNVTVKGKVVGKTTKGMKKTGIAAYDSADEEVDVISSKTTPKAPMQMVPVTQARQDIHPNIRKKVQKLLRLSPANWTEQEFLIIKKAMSETEEFSIPQYSTRRLTPVDIAAHMQLLGDSLNLIAEALKQQSSMTVHGALSVMLDSILCALAPLACLTSFIPEMRAIPEESQAATLDNIAYILPGL